MTAIINGKTGRVIHAEHLIKQSDGYKLWHVTKRDTCDVDYYYVASPSGDLEPYWPHYVKRFFPDAEI